MREIVIATNYSDWEGLYINGVLVTEGHKVTAEDVLNALDLNWSEINAIVYIDEHNSLPTTLKELDGE